MKKENNQNEWIHSTLEKVLETLMDGTHFSPQSKSGVFKYITSKNIRMGRLDLSNVDYISEEEHKKIYKSCPVKKGDVLLTKDGANTGNVTINTLAEEFSLLSSVAVLSGKKDTLDNRFLFQYLASSKSQYILKSEMAGQAITRLTLTTLKNIPIPLPPLPEQKKIAVILSTWDEAIEKLESLVALKEKRKKGLMQSLLTGKKRLKGFKTKAFQKTKIGMTPEDWEVEKIISIADYADYRGKTPKKTKSGIFLVTAKNIKQGYIDYSLSQEFIDPKDYDIVMKRGLPQIGDVLITTEAPCGNVAQIDKENIALAQRVIKYRGKVGKLYNTYLKYYFLSESFQNILDDNSTGGTVRGIKGSRLHQLPIPLPPLPEQKRIAEVLSAADNEINLHKEEIEKIKLQKRGLMQKLLTGKVRVNG